MNINTLVDKGNIYFISDLHYNHENVIKMDGRNFNDVNEMNTYIEQELENKLKPGDILFDLGDLFLSCTVDVCEKVLKKIKCEKIFKIVGNHDKSGLYYNQAPLKKYFEVIGDIFNFNINGQDGKTYFITASHYPILDFNGMYRGGIHLFGHTHGHIDKWVDQNPRLMVDLGYNGNLARKLGTFIIPFQEILNHFYEKTGGLDFSTWASKYDASFY